MSRKKPDPAPPVYVERNPGEVWAQYRDGTEDLVYFESPSSQRSRTMNHRVTHFRGEFASFKDIEALFVRVLLVAV